MRDTKKSGSGIFLMEMIMVCGFFLLCAAVCVRAFVQADSLSRMAREKNQAVLEMCIRDRFNYLHLFP